jgi:hypothetical protein
MVLSADCSVCEVRNFSILPPHFKLTLHQNHVFTDMKHETNRDLTADIDVAIAARIDSRYPPPAVVTCRCK